MSWHNLFERIEQLRDRYLRRRRAPDRRPPRPVRPRVERLESRWLMSLAAIGQYPLINGTSAVYLTSGPGGEMWANYRGGIISITTAGASANTPGNYPEPTPPGGTPIRDIIDLTAASGTIWITDDLTYFPPGPGGFSVVRSAPAASAAAPAGGSTFGGGGATPMAGRPYEIGYIGSVTTAGAVTWYTLGQYNAPGMITPGPDGALWFTDSVNVPGQTSVGYIGRITTGGSVSYVTLGNGVLANGITAGPDGNPWFTLNTGYVGRVTTGGAVALFPAFSGSSITAGPDGNLWFSSNGDISRITTNGVYTPGYSLQTTSQSVTADQMQFGPGGLLWFANNFDSFGSLDITNGNVTYYRLDGVIQSGIGNGSGYGLTVGPDGRVWMIAGGNSQEIDALNYAQVAWPVVADPVFGSMLPVPGGPGSGGPSGGGPGGASDLPVPGGPGGGQEPLSTQNNFAPSLNMQTSGSSFTPVTGDLKDQTTLDTALSSSGCSCSSPFSLTYNSATVNVTPTIEFKVYPQGADGLPTLMQAAYNQFLGSPPYSTYNTSALVAGQPIVAAIQSPAAATQTGTYRWQVEAVETYAGGDLDTFSLGIVPLVVNNAPYGAGWSVSGVDSLVPNTSTISGVPLGVQYVYGSGGSRFFLSNGDGTYTGPPDDHGRLASSTAGGVTTYTYTTPQLTTYTFNGTGQLLTKNTPQQLTTTFTYSSGNLSTIATPDGAVTTFLYTSGYLTSVLEPASRTLTVTRGGSNSNDLAGITFPDGGVRTFTYDGSHRLTGDAWGPLAANYAYNTTFQYLTTITLAAGQTINLQPEFGILLNGPVALTAEPLTLLTDARSHTTSLALDHLGALLVVESPDGGTTSYVRDNAEDPTSVTDPRGNTTAYFYDTFGDVTQIDNPDGSVEQYQYDPRFHLETVSVDGDGNRTTTAYDGYADPTAVTDALGRTTSYTYYGGNPGGLVSTVTDPVGNVTSYAYDGNRRLTTEVDAYGTGIASTTTMSYDAAGNLLSETTGFSSNPAYAHPSTTSYAYDKMRRMTEKIDGYGSGTPAVTSYSYDKAGDQTFVTDPDGNQTSYSYDATGRRTAETDGYNALAPATTITVYDPAGNVLSVTDPDGHVTSYAYDPVNRQTEVIGAYGTQSPSISATAYDPAGNVTSATDADGNITRYFYDPMNRQTEEIAGYGSQSPATTTTVYDPAGNVVRTIDPDGHVTSFSYDALNRQTAATEGYGSSTPSTSATVYDPAGNVVRTTDGNGNVTSYSYDALNRKTAETDGYGSTAATLTTMAYDAAGNLTQETTGYSPNPAYSNPSTATYAYDALNRRTSETDAVGTSVVRTSTTAYDPDGNVVKQIDGDGHVTIYAYDDLNRRTAQTEGYGTTAASTTTTFYDADGNVVQTIDPDGNSATFAYDALNRRTAETDAGGTPVATTTTMAYDAAGNLVSETAGQSTVVTYAHPSTTSYAFDALNRRTGETDAVGTSVARTTSTVYDPAGNVVASYDGRGNATVYTYDALNRAVTEQTPAGGYVVTNYDADGNVTAVSDQLGYTTSYTYDALNRKVTTENADLKVTTYAYDAAGNRTSLTDADGNVTTMVYDALGRETLMTDPLGHTATMAYDAIGNLTSTTDRDGRLTTYGYDALNRKTGSTWTANGVVTNVQAFTYDPAGNRLTAADYNGAYAMGYDALNRETSVQEPFAQALTYAYDAAGNRTSVQDSQGGATTSVYDALSRLTTREFGGTGQTTLREDLTYNADDQIATETRYDDLNQQIPAGTSSYLYDADDRLTSLVQTYANGSVLASYAYGYDSVSRLTQEVDNGGTPINYVYDGADQLLQAGAANYSYDPTGNRTLTGYQTGPDNQLLSDGTYSYTCDAEGNRLTKTAGSDITSYSYDNENRLTGVIETVGGTLQTQATYVYDVFGNRIETEEYTASGGAVTTEYAYDGANAWANFSSTSSLEMRQLFLPGQDQMLARVSGSGTAAWYLTDRQGSVRDVQSYDGTTMSDAIAYDAYGNITSETNAVQGDAYKYDGYIYDAPIGLYFVRARYYDAATGRWDIQDPIGFASGDTNLYRFVINAPTIHVDPDDWAPAPASGAIDYKSFRSGAEGNCWAAAAVVALAYQRPADLSSLIHDDGDGTYTVTLWAPDPSGKFNKKQFRVGDPAGTPWADWRSNGVWAKELEVGLIRAMGYAIFEGASGFDANIGKAIPYITGHQYRFMDFDAGFAEVLRKSEHRKIVLFATGDKIVGDVPQRLLATFHAYAVLGSDDYEIHVRNPWGLDIPAARELHRTRSDWGPGEFWLSLCELKQNTKTIVYEE